MNRGLPASDFKEGDTLVLSCKLIKSNPEPSHYLWYKNLIIIGYYQKYIKALAPHDGGSYTCGATNIVGTGMSLPVEINVQCKFYLTPHYHVHVLLNRMTNCLI